MSAKRWLDRSQPQTLYMAVVLLYLNSAFFAISGGLSGGITDSLIGVAVVAGGVGAGYGIANEKKWGYAFGIVMAVLPFAVRLAFLGNPLGTDLLTLMFEIALLALLLHPQSREYQRIWFK
jgi:hypothetical protein